MGRAGSNTFNLFGIPNTFALLYLTPNTKYFQVFVFDPKIPNTQFHQILFQILGKYFLKKKRQSPCCVLSYLYCDENHA